MRAMSKQTEVMNTDFHSLLIRVVDCRYKADNVRTCGKYADMTTIVCSVFAVILVVRKPGPVFTKLFQS